ncbi:MAG: transcription antitermination factor NusB [Burkholderiales bacterium]|jgi:N utilization substance protein B|nr:transcription antitermination factor NusB [Burkholderiales bacterium]
MNPAEPARTDTPTAAGRPATKPRTPRRRARESAVQVLYAWLLNPEPAGDVKRQARLDADFPKLDAGLFDALVDGVVAHADALRAALQPTLDRPAADLSPVEHAILLVAAEELLHHPQTPYRVVINEAVDLAKVFGGTDGHKYVNGVLDRVAAQARPQEVAARRQG